MNRKVNLLKEILRNTVTKIKQDSKFKHYKEYFELHKDKSASIRKGIRSLIKLKSLSKKDISIVADKEVLISDQVIKSSNYLDCSYKKECMCNLESVIELNCKTVYLQSKFVIKLCTHVCIPS